MLKNIIIQLYFFLSYLMGYGQNAEIVREVFLPEELLESSGILFYPPDKLMQINDSGNAPEIVVTDTLGKLLQKYCLPGLENIDWEELARDNEGNVYIGDFGNNLNRRKDLLIYKLDEEKLLKGDDSFEVAEIRFQYEDQRGFPPDRERRHFDMEAMIYLDDSLYLFAKNRSSPFDGYIYTYRLPARAGNFTAEKIDSFQTAQGLMESFWVCGADYRAHPPTLLLVGYDKLWMFYNFKGKRFFSGKHNILYFNSFTQKEGVSFMHKDRIVVVDEKNSKRDGKLYFIELPDIKEQMPAGDSSAYSIDPLSPEFEEEINIKINCLKNCSIDWEAYNEKGQRLHFGQARDYPPGDHQINIGTADWDKGNYELHLLINGQLLEYSIRKGR